MEDMNEYWLDYPPIFSNIDWTDTTTNSIPTPEYEQKIPPFQRRRSSSVDLPINPLYLNSSRFTFGSSPIAEEETTFFSDKQSSKIGSSSTLEFPLSTTTSDYFDFNLIDEKQPQEKPVLQQQQPQQDQKQEEVTFFPELQRTSYNTILGQQLQKHQKRRRSSSLPPVFKQQQKRVPTPLIFTQIQVTDPRPVQHTQKAAKVVAKPIPIERVVKKPSPLKPEECDPLEKQKKMDQTLIHLNFDDVTVAELKDMLKERGLPNTGKKAILIQRLKQVRENLLHFSPAIQGIANMTIHSPLPPTMDDDQILYPNNNDNNNNYPSSSSTANMNMNDFLDFNLDNTLLFPQQPQTNLAFTEQKRPPMTSWDSEWDQERLDHFLTELV